MKNEKRYQNCSWYEKLWRRRHYISVPWVGFKIWWHERRRPLDDEDDWRMTFGQCVGLAKGLAQAKMNWVYDWDEVKERLEKRFKND
jgi:hypothetical protein